MWYGNFVFITAFVVNVSIEDLSLEQAKALAREYTRGAESEQDVRQRLNKAGFNGDSAAVDFLTNEHGSMFMVMLNHPNGEIISI